MFAAGSLLIVVTGVAVRWLGRPDMFITRSRAALDAQDRRRFLQRVRAQVSDLLWQPPDDPEPLRLELAARPELVGTPRELFARGLAERGEPATVDAAFEAAEDALLLVGAPGAGKSRLLAEFAASLVTRADHDPTQPIPALVNLASWAAPQPLTEWLAGALRDRYEVPAALGQAWIAADRVLPLLDGLDEVADPAACASAIDAFRTEHGLVPFAVCCRLADYQRLGVRLRLRGAVQIQPLTDQQVDSCLAEAGIASAARAALGEEGRGLIDSPLMLSMTVRTFRAQPGTPVPTTGPPGERRSRLFDAYIDAMLARRRDRLSPGEPAAASRYRRDETLAWLGWLARSMRAHHQTQFSLDRLQPTWLATPRQRGTMSDSVCCASLFGSGVVAALIGYVIGGLLFSGRWVNGPVIGISVWLVSVHVVPLVFIVRVLAGRSGPARLRKIGFAR